MKKQFIHYSEGDLYVSSMLGEEPEYVRQLRGKLHISSVLLYDIASVHAARTSVGRSCVGCEHRDACAHNPALRAVLLSIEMCDMSSLKKERGFRYDSDIRTEVDTPEDKDKRNRDYAKRYLERFLPRNNGTGLQTEQSGV